jgi:NhaP-type Na+/H+ or K+/H+ antiporter
VLLPIVLVALIVQGVGAASATSWPRLGLDLLVLGPGAGVLVGVIGLVTLDRVRGRLGVRRDYESLYSLGIAFAAYAAAESVHGSGFLAAFAAGLTIASFDVDLCDCFREYGETTAELALLLTFVLLGSSLIWSGIDAISGPVLAFVALVMIGRPVIYLAALAPARIDRRTRWLVAWFGPRGLSSLLLALLAVFAGAPDAPKVFQIASLVVLVSIALHGATLIWLGRGAPVARDPELITIGELLELRADGAMLRPVDVRRDEQYAESDERAHGAVRLSPKDAVAGARRLALPTDGWLMLYCACPNELTSSRVARELIRAGWPHARALIGGYDAWKAAGLGTEKKTAN